MALSGGQPACRVRGCRVKSARTRTRGLVHLAPVSSYAGPMERRNLYDDDIYAWAREQAEVLRRLAETRRDLPNELDLETDPPAQASFRPPIPLATQVAQRGPGVPRRTPEGDHACDAAQHRREPSVAPGSPQGRRRRRP